MTEDMPTVDGARAEARRRYPYDTNLDAIDRTHFIAGAEWLAPTVAALEAEVARQTARADAAEAERDALQERVRRTIAAIDADVVLYRPDATDGREGA